MGRHQLRLLRFAILHPASWHPHGTDKSTREALQALHQMELLEHDPTRRRFRLAIPSPHRTTLQLGGHS